MPKLDPPPITLKATAQNNENIRRTLLKGLITKMKKNRITIEQAAKLLERWYFPK